MKKEYKLKWMNGIAYEVAFWNNVYRWDKAFKALIEWSNYERPINLENFDANYFLKCISNPIVFDVGCGLSYATGNKLVINDTEKIIDIQYIDPLATYFNKIIKKRHRNMPPITFGTIEHFSTFYPAEHADLIIVQNALDHSAYPIRGIFELMKVLKSGGVLYLNHHPNEAETENYKGFHQHNITEDNGQLIIWNENERHNINTLVDTFATIDVSRSSQQHVVAVIRKEANIPSNLIGGTDENISLYKQMFCENIQDFTQTTRFKLSYWKYNTIQFFVQSLSWEVKMRLKKLIGQA